MAMESDVLSEFRERLRILRESRELTQSELGQVLRVSKQTISNYENGISAPDQETLGRLADYFGVSTDYLLGRTDDPGRPAKDSATSNTSLPDWVKKLPPDMQKFVEEESKHGWPYLRLARGLKMKDLSPAELEAIVETWMDAKKRYEREFGKNSDPAKER